MEEIFLQTSDGINIAMNFYQKETNELVIIAPGWFMTKDSDAFKMFSKELSKSYNVMTFDFRGHGRSTGKFTFTSKEIIDIKTVVDYGKERFDNIFLIGFSLGASVSIIHASMKKDIKKLIAVSAPTCFEKIENEWWKSASWLSIIIKFDLKRYLSISPDFSQTTKIKPINVIQEVEAPTLFITGDKDTIIHPWHSKELFDKATCKKELKVIKDGFHSEDLFLKDNFEFVKICKKWLDMPDFREEEPQKLNMFK